MLNHHDRNISICSQFFLKKYNYLDLARSLRKVLMALHYYFSVDGKDTEEQGHGPPSRFT